MRPVPFSSISLRDLEYAVAVGRERNFGRAAEACGVSQAALSEQVRKLESVLGLPLFERTTRKVEPTVRGRAILERAEALLAGARQLLDEARRSAEPLSGELRVGVIPTLGPYYMPFVIALCRERFPRLALRLRESTTNEVLRALRIGELDAAFVALPVAGTDLVADPLFFEPFRLACPPDHEFATRETISTGDIRRGPLLLMEEEHCLRDQALALCDPSRIGHQSRHASSLEMLRHMIAAGEGISVLPSLATGDATTMHDAIVYRTLADQDAGRTIALARRATETRTADLDAIASALRGNLPEAVRAVAPRHVESE